MTLEEQRERVRVLSNGAFKLESKTHLKHGDKCVMVCSKGHKIETLWKDLGKKLSSETFCNDCYMLAKMDKRAKEKGYKLLSKKWEGYLATYTFECPNNHKQEYNWKYFNDQEGNHCAECYNLRVQNGEHNQMGEDFKKQQEKLLLERVEELGYKLKSNYQYSNNKDRVNMICNRGHDYSILYSHFMQGKKCRKCSYEDAMLTEEQLTKELAEMGYEYLGEYKGVNEPLKYKCTCGQITYKRIEDLRRGQKCMRCAKKHSVEKRRLERVKYLEENFKTTEERDK